MDMAFGFPIAQTLYVAAKLDIANVLVEVGSLFLFFFPNEFCSRAVVTNSSFSTIAWRQHSGVFTIIIAGAIVRSLVQGDVHH